MREARRVPGDSLQTASASAAAERGVSGGGISGVADLATGPLWPSLQLPVHHVAATQPCPPNLPPVNRESSFK